MERCTPLVNEPNYQFIFNSFCLKWTNKTTSSKVRAGFYITILRSLKIILKDLTIIKLCINYNFKKSLMRSYVFRVKTNISHKINQWNGPLRLPNLSKLFSFISLLLYNVLPCFRALQSLTRYKRYSRELNASIMFQKQFRCFQNIMSTLLALSNKKRNRQFNAVYLNSQPL